MWHAVLAVVITIRRHGIDNSAAGALRDPITGVPVFGAAFAVVQVNDVRRVNDDHDVPQMDAGKPPGLGCAIALHRPARKPRRVKSACRQSTRQPSLAARRLRAPPIRQQ